MNTYDGRIFFEKDNGTPSVQEIFTTNSDVTGSLNLNGAITASSLEITGNANITGNLVLGGNITIGDASADTISLGGEISTNIIPSTDNTLSLGSSTRRFQLNGGTPVTVTGSGAPNTLTRFSGSTEVENSTITNTDTLTEIVHSNDGEIIFTVSGSNGELFTVTDSNSGNLLEVNDTSGIDVFTVSAIGDVSASGAITASGITGLTSLNVNGNISGSSFNGTGLLSGSSQVVIGDTDGFTSFSSSVASTFDGLSSNYDDLVGIPSGIVSGSSQVTISDTTGFTSFSSSVDTSIQTEKGRIDAILASSDADKDSFAEIVTLINSVDTANDNAFASFYTSSNDRFDSLESFTSSIDTTIKTKLDADGVISGSTQITDGSGLVSSSAQVISHLPTGTVSGSSQLTSSFDSRYLNVSGEGNISGSFTGSFSGDGSNITNITVDAAATVSSTFTNSSSVTVSHNFNTRNILVAVYDDQNNQIIPQNVNTSNLDQVVITLSSAQSGTVVVAKGGHIISGSANDSNQLNGQNASYYLDYDNFTNIPSGIVSGSSQTIANLPTGVVSGSQSDARGQLGLDTGDSPTFTDLTLSGDLVVQGTTTTLNTTTFNVEDNIIELNYGGTATEGGIFVKDSTGGSTTSGSLLWDATNDYWKAGISGSESKVLLANGDSIVSSSAQTILHLGGTDIISGSSQLDGTTIGASSDIVASGSFSGSYKGDGSGLTGIQVDQVASVTASFSNQSTINVSHNFDSYNVIVSTYDTNYNQLIPQTVSLTDTNTVQVVLSANHSGHVVVAKGGHVVSGSTSADNISGLDDKIQELTSYRESVSGASFYNITHSLDEEYPFVQAWNTSNNTQEQPLDIESVNANVISVSFSANFTGKIIVKK